MLASTLWRTKQFGDVFDRFRADCPPKAWRDVLLRYAILLGKGKECGSHIAKKLKAGDGIWELLGHADNLQPRLFFYFSRLEPQLIVFVHAWMKQGANYRPHIELSQRRRAMIERGERIANVIASESTRVN